MTAPIICCCSIVLEHSEAPPQLVDEGSVSPLPRHRDRNSSHSPVPLLRWLRLLSDHRLLRRHFLLELLLLKQAPPQQKVPVPLPPRLQDVLALPHVEHGFQVPKQSVPPAASLVVVVVARWSLVVLVLLTTDVLGSRLLLLRDDGVQAALDVSPALFAPPEPGEALVSAAFLGAPVRLGERRGLPEALDERGHGSTATATGMVGLVPLILAAAAPRLLLCRRWHRGRQVLQPLAAKGGNPFPGQARLAHRERRGRRGRESFDRRLRSPWLPNHVRAPVGARDLGPPYAYMGGHLLMKAWPKAGSLAVPGFWVRRPQVEARMGRGQRRAGSLTALSLVVGALSDCRGWPLRQPASCCVRSS